MEETTSENSNKIEEFSIREETPKLNPPTVYPNLYAAKKTVAQGMMDIALLTSNANQLRYLIEFSSHSPMFIPILLLISISILIQVGVGVALIFKGRYDLSGEEKQKISSRINNYVVVGVFIVTIINVFVAAFSIPVGTPDNNQNNMYESLNNN